MKNYLRNTLSRLGEASRAIWACLGGVFMRSGACLAVVPLRAGRKRVLPALIAVLNLLLAGRVTAQTFTTLYSFTYNDGANPQAGLITNSSGNTLYGTTADGRGAGTVFALKTDGTGFTNLHSFTATSDNGFGSFTNSDGAYPWAGVIVSGNTLYGTARQGGSTGHGTVFALNTNGTGFTNLHSFTVNCANGCDFDADCAFNGGVCVVDPLTYLNCCYASNNRDGAYPFARLIANSSGNTLYGTAFFGGGSVNGTVFGVNTDGTGFTNLHSFPGGTFSYPYITNSDGALPRAGLILSGNTLYGTAYYGGSSGNGTVFAINTDGTGFTALHSFIGSDGAYPVAGLVLSGNTLYGTAQYGGSSGNGTVFAVNTDGTGFTTLHTFSHPVSGTNSDGGSPVAPLILSGNTLYGTATAGGSSGNGTVFAVHTDATGFTNLHSFNALSIGPPYPRTNSDGAGPIGLILSGNTLYGTAVGGGSWNAGTVFSISFRPQLTITPSGVPPSGIILSWPTNVAGFDYTRYTLQCTTNLVSPAFWSTNSPAPVVIAGQNTVTNPVSGAQKFYRLVQ